MEKYKLQNIVFPLQKDGKLLFPWSLCCSEIAPDSIDEKRILHLHPGQCANFDTYFNALSLLRWKRFTVAKNFSLDIEIQGKIKIQFHSLDKKKAKYYDSSFVCTSLTEYAVDAPTRKIVSFKIPETNAPLVSFSLYALEECRFYNGAYSDRNVKICPATRTLKIDSFRRSRVEDSKSG